jgi:hypothetical protein
MLRRLACSLVALSLGVGIAAAHPSAYRFEDDLVNTSDVQRFAQPPADEPVADAPAPVVVDRAAVRAALAARRKQNLALFHAYRTGGVYPHNFVQAGKLNVWLDPEGHLCAAATIINNGGNADLAMSVPAMNNYLRLIDVTEGPLMDWILTSGFTQDEIAMIQEPFVGPQRPVVKPTEPTDDMRTAEDARLAKRYAQVEKALIKARTSSLDAATDRLILDNPELAASLVAAL